MSVAVTQPLAPELYDVDGDYMVLKPLRDVDGRDYYREGELLDADSELRRIPRRIKILVEQRFLKPVLARRATSAVKEAAPTTNPTPKPEVQHAGKGKRRVG